MKKSEILEELKKLNEKLLCEIGADESPNNDAKLASSVSDTVFYYPKLVEELERENLIVYVINAL